jgi:hypothetical protein
VWKKVAPKTLFIVNYIVDRALATSEEGEQYPFLVYLAPSMTLFTPPLSNSGLIVFLASLCGVLVVGAKYKVVGLILKKNMAFFPLKHDPPFKFCA